MWTMPRPDRGVLFVITGPSGVGKSTLLGALTARVPFLEFSVSATTRGPREGERDGVHYHFLDEEAFARAVEEGAFLEHAGVYDRRYGTLRAPVEAALKGGASVLLDIDVQGFEQLQAAEVEMVSIFIMPPNLHTLRERLTARGTESAEVVERRMSLVADQIRGAPGYDYVVVNDDLPVATQVLCSICVAEMSRVSRRASMVSARLSEL